MKIAFALVCLAVMLFAGACGADDSEDPMPAKVAFEGNIPDTYVGLWKTHDGMSTYELQSDGKYVLNSKIRVQGRDPIDSHLEGEWRVNGDRMLFKDGRGDVVPYAFALEGDTLELSLTGNLKNKTVLKRQ